jgi:hypothetical protein
MHQTPTGAALLAIAREAGLVDYDVLRGAPATSKLARLRTRNGVPIAIQISNKVPRIWLRPEHDTPALSSLGKREHYEVRRGRHHHLDQVREFVGQSLIKIAVLTESRAEIRAAFDSLVARRGLLAP